MVPHSKKMKSAPAKRSYDESTATAGSTSNDSTVKSSEKESSVSRRKQKSRRFQEPRYFGDCLTDEMNTPRRARRNWQIAKQTVSANKKKIRTLHERNRRLKAKVVCFKSLLEHLSSTNLVTKNATLILNATVPDSTAEIMRRFLKGPSHQQYSPELRAFALTLNFYSAKAYNYVRSKFNNSLPDPRTLRTWYRSINGAPGFTEEALNAIQIKAQTAYEAHGHKILCNLVIGEMAIRKKVEFVGGKWMGFIDIGTNLYSDFLSQAREALVFMVVALNDSWKIPIGYFLIDGLNGSEKANLINRALDFLNESDIIITSLTFDGTMANFSMANHLGAELQDPYNLKTFFLHPVTGEKIYVYLNPSHMLKLIRNCLASMGLLIDGEGGQIMWDFFVKLIELQETEGLHAANKLRKRHLQWAREKMKVKIAAQTFSNSVANAFLFLCCDLKLTNFGNVGPTAKFCKILNNLFDIFNTRNMESKTKLRRPLCKKNSDEIFEYLQLCKKYFLELKIKDDLAVISQRKTGFVGFLICIESLIGMYKDYVANDTSVKIYFNIQIVARSPGIFFFCCSKQRWS